MKKISKIIQWFFAVTFALGALGTGSIISSIFVLIASVLMAPIKPIREALLKLKIKGSVAIILSIVLLFVGFAFAPTTENPDNQDNSAITGAIVDSSTTMTTTTTTTTTETTTETTAEESTTVPESTVEEITTEEETTTIPKTTTEKSTTKEETTTKKAEMTTSKAETTTSKAETTTKKVTTTKKETTTKQNTATSSSGTMVWIPQSGSKYHSYSSCSGMKNPSKVTEKQAVDWGYTACKRCH